MMVPENTKPVVGFPAYRVSTRGEIWSCVKRVGLKGRIGSRVAPGSVWRRVYRADNDGYLQVYLSNCNGCAMRKRIHQIVLEAFVGPRPRGTEACHNDGNRKNNALSNLRWDTPSGNWKDRKRHGRGSSMVKLSREQVREIRSTARYHGVFADFGRKFSVTAQAIRYAMYYGSYNLPEGSPPA